MGLSWSFPSLSHVNLSSSSAVRSWGQESEEPPGPPGVLFCAKVTLDFESRRGELSGRQHTLPSKREEKQHQRTEATLEFPPTPIPGGCRASGPLHAGVLLEGLPGWWLPVPCAVLGSPFLLQLFRGFFPDLRIRACGVAENALSLLTTDASPLGGPGVTGSWKSPAPR